MTYQPLLARKNQRFYFVG